MYEYGVWWAIAFIIFITLFFYFNPKHPNHTHYQAYAESKGFDVNEKNIVKRNKWWREHNN